MTRALPHITAVLFPCAVWHKHGDMPRRVPSPACPLDQAALERLALRYVERFATTRSRLADYLRRKMRERDWEGPAADPTSIAEKLAALGYIDDRAFGEARAATMARRGLGARRVAQDLRQAGITTDDAAAIAPQVETRAVDAALAFARRRRFGPWAIDPADRPTREKQMGAMIRAGHKLDLARRIVAADCGSDPEMLFDDT